MEDAMTNEEFAARFGPDALRPEDMRLMYDVCIAHETAAYYVEDESTHDLWAFNSFGRHIMTKPNVGRPGCPTWDAEAPWIPVEGFGTRPS